MLKKLLLLLSLSNLTVCYADITIISSNPASGVTAGSYTNTNLTVNAQGILTTASNGTATGGGYSVEPATVSFLLDQGFRTTSATFTALGPGIMHITAGSSVTVTGVALSTEGGTGLASITTGDLIYGNGTNTYGKLTKDTNSTRYLSNQGIGNTPSWGQVNLANGVTGTLPLSNLVSSITVGGVLVATGPVTITQGIGVTTITAASNYLSNTAVYVASVTAGNSISITGTNNAVAAAPIFNVNAASVTTSGPINILVASVTAGTSMKVTGTNNVLNAAPIFNVDCASVTCQGAIVSSMVATAVTAGSYTNTSLTVDGQGRITSASNGTALSNSVSLTTPTIVGLGAGTTAMFVKNDVGTQMTPVALFISTTANATGNLVGVDLQLNNGSDALTSVGGLWAKTTKVTPNTMSNVSLWGMNANNRTEYLQYNGTTVVTYMMGAYQGSTITVTNALNLNGPVYDVNLSSGSANQVLKPSGLGAAWSANNNFYNAVKTASYTMTTSDSIIFASGTTVGAGTIMIVTLPVASNTGQQATIIKVDKSTACVMVQAPSPSLLGSTTDQFRMYAPGQSIVVVADGTNWQPIGSLPVTPPFLGSNFDPNSAAAVTASTTYCNAVWTPTFMGVTSIRMNVGAQALQTQVGIYDSLGLVISTSAKTTIGTGIITINLSKTAYLAPGTNWLCVNAESATTTITRQSAATGFEGSCSFATNAPLPTTETFSGCTAAANFYSLAGLVGGGTR